MFSITWLLYEEIVEVLSLGSDFLRRGSRCGLICVKFLRKGSIIFELFSNSELRSVDLLIFYILSCFN